jgi:hypothetical protein
MVRHARAEQYEDVRRPVLAVGNDYPADHTHPLHQHRRAQLLHAITGTMVVTTDQAAGSCRRNKVSGFQAASGTDF